MMELTAQNVDRIFTDCLSRETGEITEAQADQIRRTEEAPPGWISVRGVVLGALLNCGRVKAHTPEIAEMLSQLPDNFHEGKGDGWSFLNACMTKDGQQWGEHRDIDVLCCLGVAAGLVEFIMPRSAWSSCPGGLPYFLVKPLQNQQTEQNK